MRRMDDDGQLMMLAGIVLTISFILTALTLAQVSALEREAASTTASPIVAEWRFLHDRLASNLDIAVGVDTSNDTYKTTILPTVQATFRSVESEKGYDLQLRRAAGADYATTGNEEDLRAGSDYDAWTWDGAYHLTHPHDAVDDGIVWEKPCPDTDGALAAGCISGVYVYVSMTDGTATMEESILFAVNRP